MPARPVVRKVDPAASVTNVERRSVDHESDDAGRTGPIGVPVDSNGNAKLSLSGRRRLRCDSGDCGRWRAGRIEGSNWPIVGVARSAAQVQTGELSAG